MLAYAEDDVVAKAQTLGVIGRDPLGLTASRRYTAVALGGSADEDAQVLVMPNESSSPWWFPAALFRFPIAGYPPHWMVGGSVGSQESWTFIAGYAEIATDPAHYAGLWAHDPSAVGVFSERYDFEVVADELCWHLHGLIAGTVTAFEAAHWAAAALSNGSGNLLDSDPGKADALAEVATIDNLTTDETVHHARILIAR